MGILFGVFLGEVALPGSIFLVFWGVSLRTHQILRFSIFFISIFQVFLFYLRVAESLYVMLGASWGPRACFFICVVEPYIEALCYTEIK